MGKHDVITHECEERIKHLLLSGISIAKTAFACGVSNKSVQIRRSKLVRSNAKFAACKCGKSVSHRGMCAHKWALEKDRSTRPAKKEFDRTRDLSTYRTHLRRAKKINIPNSDCGASEMFDYVNRIIPYSFPSHVRDDSIQDILVDVLSGTLPMRDIHTRFPYYISSVFSHDRQFSISLDEKIGERTVYEIIADIPHNEDMEKNYEDAEEGYMEYVDIVTAGRNGIKAGFKRPDGSDA